MKDKPITNQFLSERYTKLKNEYEQERRALEALVSVYPKDAKNSRLSTALSEIRLLESKISECNTVISKQDIEGNFKSITTSEDWKNLGE